MEPTQVIETIKKSFNQTLINIQDRKKPFQNLKQKSSLFIKNTTINIQEYFTESNKEIVVFSKEVDTEIFKLNEFLYDIHVCEIEYLESSVHHKEIPFVKKSLLQIESEFSPSIRESAVDFSKLVVGNAEIKIMILPLSSNNDEKENYLKPLIKIAGNINETLFCIFIPHPKHWSRPLENTFKCYKYTQGKWQSIDEVISE